MPCWYYDKKELRNTPSFRDNIDPDTESRYRREGARFVLDCGTKLGLRYDTCGTGAIYFHRFYMFRSFREFHRYVTACSCLFLAGKVEETPKKCKDLLRITKSMLTERQFNKIFSDDPKEEILLVERILLQTLRFDLMVEHPYSHLLRFGKMLKGDKNKVQKMVQMSWTFINDSLCTTLCLQWEAEVIGVALIYLATRLSKVDIHDWEGKPSGFQGKWWEHVIKEVNLELLEDICHQVLDLYSQQMSAEQHAKARAADSPPPPPPPPPQAAVATTPSTSRNNTPQSTTNKRSRSNTPVDFANKKFKGQGQPVATPQGSAIETITTGHAKTPSPTPTPYVRQGVAIPQGAVGPTPQLVSPSKPVLLPTPGQAPPVALGNPATLPHHEVGDIKDGEAYNPFVSTYSSSFMSGEGSKSIQNLMSQPPPPSPVTQAATGYPNYPPPNFSQPPPNVQGQTYTPTSFTPHQHYNNPPPSAPPTQQVTGGYNNRHSNFQQPSQRGASNSGYSQGSGYNQPQHGHHQTQPSHQTGHHQAQQTHHPSYGAHSSHTSYSNQNYDKQGSGNFSTGSSGSGYTQNQYYSSHHQQNYQPHSRGSHGSAPHHRGPRM